MIKIQKTQIQKKKSSNVFQKKYRNKMLSKYQDKHVETQLLEISTKNIYNRYSNQNWSNYPNPYK